MIRTSERRFRLLSAAGFLVAGVALYARALTIPFVSDDWEFLLLIDTSRSIAVCFELLVQRFVRPLVMLTYYTGYKTFGLWPMPYHLFLILLHALNAWLLCLVTIRLDARHRRWMGAGTGLLFLAFAGHTEAVTWVAGAADPFVAACAFGMLLATDRALETTARWRFLAIAWLLMAAALLGKESAVVLPALVFVYAAVRGAPFRRALLAVSVPILLVGIFWIVRTEIFGMPSDAYAGLGGHAGMLFAHLRALVIRSFVPPSNRLALAWQTGRDAPFVVVGFVAIAVMSFRRGGNRRAAIFSLCALAITLAPAVPLSISVGTTESERMIYVPSAFAALMTVLAIDALSNRRAVAAALVGVLVAGHAVLLQRMHGRWRAAGEVFDGVMQTFVQTVRAHDPGPDGLVFILNLPDSVRGAYVLRRGFYARLHFLAPDLEARAASIIGVETQTMQAATDGSTVRRVTANEMSLDVAPNIFLNVAPPVRPFYTFPEWNRVHYLLQFTPAVGVATVLGVSAGQTSFLADVTGPGAPFGFIDMPGDEAVCDGQIRISGWALDDREVTRIVARRDREPADSPGPASVEIGEGTWTRDTRPDIASVYKGFPHTERAEWNVYLSCAVLDALPGRQARVRISAVDAAGHETELGARTIHASRPDGIAR